MRNRIPSPGEGRREHMAQCLAGYARTNWARPAGFETLSSGGLRSARNGVEHTSCQIRFSLKALDDCVSDRCISRWQSPAACLNMIGEVQVARAMFSWTSSQD